MTFAASVSPDRCGKGRDVACALTRNVPANPFVLTFVPMMKLGNDFQLMAEVLSAARKAIANGNIVHLQLALSVMRIQARKMIDEAEAIAALLPPHEIEDAINVYRE